MPSLLYDTQTQAFKESSPPMVWDDGSRTAEVGQDYALGSGAATNTNGTITAKCLSISETTAVMQTYGVTAGAWPGDTDLTSFYTSYWGGLLPAISNTYLPTGTSPSSVSPSGSLEILLKVCTNYAAFNAGGGAAWLGTPDSLGRTYAWYVHSGGTSSVDQTAPVTRNWVHAPYFTLDLTKVKINMDYTIVAK